MPSPPLSTADLTTVPARNVETVTALLDGQHGTVMQTLARDAVARAWMGDYLTDGGAILLDVIRHAGPVGATLAALQGQFDCSDPCRRSTKPKDTCRCAAIDCRHGSEAQERVSA